MSRGDRPRPLPLRTSRPAGIGSSQPDPHTVISEWHQLRTFKSENSKACKTSVSPGSRRDRSCSVIEQPNPPGRLAWKGLAQGHAASQRRPDAPGPPDAHSSLLHSSEPLLELLQDGELTTLQPRLFPERGCQERGEDEGREERTRIYETPAWWQTPHCTLSATLIRVSATPWQRGGRNRG